MTALPALSASRTLMEPRSLEEAFKFAEMLADSSMVPRDFQGKPGNVLVAMQWGRELGLAPLQSLQSIAVINGRPALWGDAVLGLVRATGELDYFEEGTRGEGDAREGYCVIERRGRPRQVYVFSVADAKRAQLWTKQGPWTTYPDRMLKLRARGFGLRDEFTDVLRGIITIEEARDTPEEPRDVPNLESGPMVAPPGSLRETAAAVTGRLIAEVMPEETPEEGLPLLDPAGKLLEIRKGVKSGAPAHVLWAHTAGRILRSLDRRGAVMDWSRENLPHFASVAVPHPETVADVESAIEARLEELLASGVVEPNSAEGEPGA